MANLNVERVVFGMSAFVLGLWLADEAKIETEQEEDEMDDGAAGDHGSCCSKTMTRPVRVLCTKGEADLRIANLTIRDQCDTSMQLTVVP